MAQQVDLGETGKTVAGNIKRIREEQNLGYAELVRRLAELGNVIAPQGLRRIERCERRVDADDLVCLATVLNVSPSTLLAPAVEHATDRVRATPASGMKYTLTASAWWNFLTAREHWNDNANNREFRFRSIPVWIESEGTH
ncbi:hypothetical protein CH263_25650 [Rhodococcus sp. 06-1059B-a]|nr:helix-turn-helix transcriptional regulator [Rhodococcus sp. 06-1059B-a]OZD57579.1 hypothetical protein CH263_25650 [Rhodococcus sp. 06-1059B-a]